MVVSNVHLDKHSGSMQNLNHTSNLPFFFFFWSTSCCDFQPVKQIWVAPQLFNLSHLFYSPSWWLVSSCLSQPREKGRMRFHKLQNVQIALDFLKHRQVSHTRQFAYTVFVDLLFLTPVIVSHLFQVKLVNIRNDDIADGNPKLTLGLIWTIILHFQVMEDIWTTLSLWQNIIVTVTVLNTLTCPYEHCNERNKFWNFPIVG